MAASLATCVSPTLRDNAVLNAPTCSQSCPAVYIKAPHNTHQDTALATAISACVAHGRAAAVRFTPPPAAPRGFPAHPLPSSLALLQALNAARGAAACGLTADILARPAHLLAPDQTRFIQTHGAVLFSTVLASPPPPEIIVLAAGTITEDNLPRMLLAAALRFLRYAPPTEALAYYARIAEPLALLAAFVGGTAPAQVARLLALGNIVVRPPPPCKRPELVDLDAPNYVLCAAPPPRNAAPQWACARWA